MLIGMIAIVGVGIVENEGIVNILYTSSKGERLGLFNNFKYTRIFLSRNNLVKSRFNFIKVKQKKKNCFENFASVSG
ncbi:hypothetical protein Avbf_13124 [Armadillidium vulgare]|nr:hypothetical protein Avbf_13124 [Armadillidium vulgare]